MSTLIDMKNVPRYVLKRWDTVRLFSAMKGAARFETRYVENAVRFCDTCVLGLGGNNLITNSACDVISARGMGGPMQTPVIFHQ